MSEDYKNLITRPHLRELLGGNIAESTIIRYEKLGMPVVHIGPGRLPRYDYEEVLDWMQKAAAMGVEENE